MKDTSTSAVHFSFDTEVPGPFGDALVRLKEALRAEGFGLLSEIDIQATLREKTGADIGPYTILGVCNPRLAGESIAVEPKVGVFLPCTVLVRQTGGKVLVSAQDPALIDRFLDLPALKPMAAEARSRIARALGVEQ